MSNRTGVTTLVIILVIGVIGVGAFYFFTMQQDANDNTSENTPIVADDVDDAEDNAVTRAEILVRDSYDAYLTAVRGDVETSEAGLVAFKEHVTDDLASRIDEATGGDPILLGQDTPESISYGVATEGDGVVIVPVVVSYDGSGDSTILVEVDTETNKIRAISREDE